MTLDELIRERDDLRYLLWQCHAAAVDGCAVPYERWLMDNGPACAPQDVQTLRDAYYAEHSEDLSASQREEVARRERVEAAADRVIRTVEEMRAATGDA